MGQAGSAVAGGFLYEQVGLKALILMTAAFVLLGFLVVPRLKVL